MEKVDRVFILGAGFSAALGGPLFSQLLSREFDFTISDCIGARFDYESRLLAELPRILSRIEATKAGKAYDEHRPVRNAEQTLEFYTDLASSGSGKTLRHVYELLVQYKGTPNVKADELEQQKEVATLCKVLKRHLAISTSDFVCRLPRKSERWDPFIRWFEKLTANDVIISFNYDPVVETIARFCDRHYYTKDEEPVSQLTSLATDNPKLLKLHGSADWLADGAASSINEVKRVRFDTRTEPESERLIFSPMDILIGVPGVGKKNLREGILKGLWDEAERSIKAARKIAIIGYSMPATDNTARWTLLNALTVKPSNSIDLVLGADETSATHRMLALLKHKAPHRVTNTRLYAQDYIDQRV